MSSATPASGDIVEPRVLIIEDEEAVGAVLLRSVERAGFEAAWAATGAEARALKASFKPNVALVDLELPDTNGITLIKWLVEQGDCGVIVVSGVGDESDRIVGLELGADDYIVKPPGLRELIARIRAVHRRTALRSVAPTVVPGPGVLVIDTAKRTVHTSKGERLALTGAEFLALDMLSKAAGAVVTRDQLSETVLRRAWQPTDRSVDQLILTLRQKLPPDADGQSLIQSVRGYGYVLRAS